MIRMKQPSLVVHSHDVPGYKYQMRWTWRMMLGATAADIANWVQNANGGRFGAGQRLENVVINCHGGPGELYIGGVKSSPLDIGGVGVFAPLARLSVGTIWVVACEVAHQQGVASGGVGKRFCSALAQAAGCDVIAGAADQYVNTSFYLRGCPWGCIDGYEGLTYRFRPDGRHQYYVS